MTRGWSIVMLVVVVASIVALWPRSGGVEGGPSEAIANNVAPVGPEPTLSRPDDAARAAALPLCPPPVP
ncbi:TlpA family protein disulfide reductase, partial [Rhodococcus fascians]|nr:TlpA family protein disulfide reductase [Rhodococcus fascians]